MTPKPIARRKIGRPCQDCGRTIPVRTVRFWVNGMPYVVCKDCEKEYGPRGINVICWPVRTDAGDYK